MSSQQKSSTYWSQWQNNFVRLLLPLHNFPVDLFLNYNFTLLIFSWKCPFPLLVSSHPLKTKHCMIRYKYFKCTKIIVRQTVFHESELKFRRKHWELLRCLLHYRIQLGNLFCSQIPCIFTTLLTKIYGVMQLLSNATAAFFSSFPVYLFSNKGN